MESVNVNYLSESGLPNQTVYADLVSLYTEIFEDADIVFFKKRVDSQPKIHIAVAYHDKNLIGFKIGYPYNEDTFYSWVGGILPAFRRKGIASQLAKLQENYAKEIGFKRLRTKSMNHFKPMMILNLKNGFDVSNIYTNTKGQTKIVFDKAII